MAGIDRSFPAVKQSKRHQEIIDLVMSQGYVSTDDLVARFNVSPQTIRRDLNELADENKIRRHHGGATIPSSSVNTAYSTRQVLQLEQKDRIAQALVRHIPDGATLFIDIGTTPEAVARALMNHNDLRIVTNNLNVASLLMAKEDFRVILAGGEVRNRDGGIVGEATLDFVSQFRLDFGILGISGIDLDGSLLDFDYHEVRVKQAIIENSRCVMLGVDHTKFGRNAMVNLGDISQINMLFTDQLPPASLVECLQGNEIHFEVVE
jgi:DeoR family glycerol-3-phosphate regulon repressor|nr:DeoR/GlpR family transcriptional regulator [Photobacterium phosphoreum]